METAIRQVVSDAVAAGGVIDIYAAAGIARPDISIIDDDFARRLTTNPHPNLRPAPPSAAISACLLATQGECTGGEAAPAFR
jgi:Domain of unknown function (DUF3387)